MSSLGLYGSTSPASRFTIINARPSPICPRLRQINSRASAHALDMFTFFFSAGARDPAGRARRCSCAMRVAGVVIISQYRRRRERATSRRVALLRAELFGDALRLLREDVARRRAVRYEPLRVPECALGNLLAIALEMRLHFRKQQQTFAAGLGQKIGVNDAVARHAVDHLPVRRRLSICGVERMVRFRDRGEILVRLGQELANLLTRHAHRGLTAQLVEL